MRIAVVNQFYPPDVSPTARLVASLARHRRHLGDEVTVVTSTARYAREGGADPHAGDRGIRLCRVPSPRGLASGVGGRALRYACFHAGAAWRLATLPRQDLVVCMTTPPYAAWLGVMHAWLHAPTRVALWNMDCYPEALQVAGMARKGSAAWRLCAALNRWLLRRVDHVVCLDGQMRGVLERYAPPRGGPAFSVVPSWEPLDRFPDPARAGAWEGVERLGLRGRLLVLYMGNAGWGHEFGTVLEAAEALRADPVSFLFVGGGTQQERIKREAQDRGLRTVHVEPYVAEEDVPRVLASADVGLVTLADGAAGVMSPSKVYAYMAMGLPVAYVGPPGTNVEDAIERSRAGIALRHGQAAALVAFLRSLRSDRRRFVAMKRSARRVFEESYSDRSLLPVMDRILDALAAEGRRAAARRPSAATNRSSRTARPPHTGPRRAAMTSAGRSAQAEKSSAIRELP
jgi:glycosyltransferase involved in cell wall biosynthesis